MPEEAIGMRIIHAPDPKMLLRMRSATSVLIYRLDPRNASWEDSLRHDRHHMGAFPIVGEGRSPGRARLEEFAAMIADTMNWLRGLHGMKLCEPAPGVGVRFRGPEGITDIELCLECSTAGVQSEGLGYSGGQFDPMSGQMLEFFSRAFPGDTGIRSLIDRSSHR